MNLTLCLTHDCQLDCEYCYAGPKIPKKMSMETARKAIDLGLAETLALAKNNPLREKKMQLGFFGGEPLLEWETLKAATEYCEKNAANSKIELLKTLTTNAINLDKKKIEYLKKHRFHLGLSIDGDQETHDILRKFKNGKKSHKAAAKTLKHFQGPDAGAEVVFVLDPKNIDRVAKGVEWLIGQNIAEISLNPNYEAEWTEKHRGIWRKQYDLLAEIYIDALRELNPLKINVIDGKIHTHVNEGYKECDKCGFGNAEIAVATSGNIYPCERIVADDSNIELLIGTVETGLDRDKIAAITARRRDIPEKCLSCEYRGRCAHWCSCVNYQTTGTVNEVADIVCFHEKLTIETADRAAEILADEDNPLFIAKFYA
jgi:uncharacterized protein